MNKTNKLSFSNIRELFLKLYPVQFFTIFTSSLSGFINGLITGRFLSSVEMVALGLFSPMTMFIAATSAIFVNGAGILCGRYMGRGEGHKVNKVFSLAVISLFVISAIISTSLYIFASPIATLLGANAEALSHTVSYIRGISLGIIPTMIVPCFMTFLQMSNKSNVSLIATLCLAILVTSFGLINVNFLHLGIFGMGISTSLSQLLIMVGLIAYFLIKKNIVKFDKAAFNIKECLEMIKFGAPSALAGVLFAIRNIFINSTGLSVGGINAANALAILGSVGGFIDAFNIGLASTVTMLVSVFVGEKDPKSVKSLVLVAITIGELVAIFKQVILIIFGGTIASSFGATGEVITIAKELLFWYGMSSFLNMIDATLNNTYATQGKTTLCTCQLAINCLIVPFTCLFIASKVGISFAWKLYFLAEACALIMFYIASCIYKKGVSTSLEDILYLDEKFEAGVSHSINVNDISKVAGISKELQDFCEENNIDSRRSKLVGLCVEEMTANIIENEFDKDKKENTVDIFASIVNDEVSIRLRDNCVPFDPHSKLGMEGKDPTEDIGIKMVAKIAKEMNYQITFGMNILTIKL